MQRVYDLGGIYVLNLHPERGVLCQFALRALLASTRYQAPPIWVTSLMNVAEWWEERKQLRLKIAPMGTEELEGEADTAAMGTKGADESALGTINRPLREGRWLVETNGTNRATLLARHVFVEDAPTVPWYRGDVQVLAQRFAVRAAQCPCIGLSPQSAQEVEDFLCEQGYPFVRCSEEDALRYACYLDLPEGLGRTRKEQIQRKSKLLAQLMELEAPLIYYSCWPNGCRAALSITGDIDSVTIQDFFRRVVEV